jgi:hypothetical protein
MKAELRNFWMTLSMIAAGSVLATGMAGAWSSGPPDGYCGNPPFMVTCEACHISPPGDGTLALTGIPPGGYDPGVTYSLTVMLADPDQRRWGFELTALETAANTQAGTFIVTDAVNTQLSNHPSPDADFLKHTSTGTHNGTLNGPVTWNFDWTAPLSGNLVTFYVAGNAADGNGASSGDYIYAIQQPIPPATTAIPPDMSPALMLVGSSFPNPAPAGTMASVRFSLERPSYVVLRIVDAQGRLVAQPFSSNLSQGFHLASWNGLTMSGQPAPRGLYFLALRAESKNFISRLIVN